MGELISTCFVMIYDNGIVVQVDYIIYLTKPNPENLFPGESILVFSNPFEAKNYIQKNTIGSEPITIAS